MCKSDQIWNCVSLKWPILLSWFYSAQKPVQVRLTPLKIRTHKLKNSKLWFLWKWLLSCHQQSWMVTIIKNHKMDAMTLSFSIETCNKNQNITKFGQIFNLDTLLAIGWQGKWLLYYIHWGEQCRLRGNNVD